jgi:hypothetical protein
MFRILLFISIMTLIIVSAGGYIAANAGWLSEDLKAIYEEHFSFVTGLASVVGLLAFASSRKIKSTDFASEELEKLKSLMQAAEELEALESNKSQTEQKLADLEKRKKLMELSVQKAGLVLFYKNQAARYETVIRDKIKNDEELSRAFMEVQEAQLRLSSLDQEIESDENVELIKDILTKHEQDKKLVTQDPLVLLFELLGKASMRMMRNIVRM